MELIKIIPALLPVAFIQILLQVYGINLVINNHELSKRKQVFLIVSIILFNNIAVGIYLLFLSRTDNSEEQLTDIFFRRGIIAFTNLAFQIFVIQTTLTNFAEESFYLIIGLYIVFYLLIICMEVLNTYYQYRILIVFASLLFILTMALELITKNQGIQMISVIAFIAILNQMKITHLTKALLFTLVPYIGFIIFKTSLIFDDISRDEVAIYMVASILVTVFVSLSFATMKKQIVQNRVLANLVNQLNEQAKTIEEMTGKQERLRIAGDIHDHVGHTLTTAVIQLESVLSIIDEDTEIINKIKIANEQVKLGLNQIRILVRGVDVDFKKPFHQNVVELVDSVKNTTDLQVHIDMVHEIDLVPLQQNILLSAIKEFFTNSVKHGKSTDVNILISKNRDQLELTLSNNGETDEIVSYGFGLTRMDKSIHSIGGIMRVSSSNDLGFIIYIKIPLGGNTNG